MEAGLFWQEGGRARELADRQHVAYATQPLMARTHAGRQAGRRARDPHLKLSECGQMGVKRMAGTFGCTMEPPAATL